MSSDKSENLQWINNLRLIALFAVIILHSTSPVLEQYGKEPVFVWLTGDFYNSLVRFAVPVFVMITGALLLHKEYELGSFLKKRFVRVVVPFLFWSLIYIAYAYYNEEIVYTGNFWATVKQVLHLLQYGSSYHLWYVYMLIGLYLVIPIIGKFVRNASEREILYFLIVWFIIMLLEQPYLSAFKPQVDVRNFEGYVGYLVLGHYLAFKKMPLCIKRWALAVFFLTLLFTTVGTYLLYNYYNGISTQLYEPLSPAILLLSASVFIMGRVIIPKMPIFITLATNFSGAYAYGIYLAHALVLTLLDSFDVNFKMFNPILSIPVTAIICFILTLLLVFIINKLPWGKYISG